MDCLRKPASAEESPEIGLERQDEAAGRDLLAGAVLCFAIASWRIGFPLAFSCIMICDMRTALVFLAAALLPAQTELAPHEKEFQDSMAGVVLEGQSTRDGRPGLSSDRYTIEKVVKQSGDTWVFHARIAYSGKQAGTVALPLEVKWAGDTPVITLTDMDLPGMGRYTARVLLYKGHYAGTWSGDSASGKVFGRIVKK
jgi:hypothetical protein